MPRFAAADRVEVVFHLGGEAVVDELRQMRFEQLRHRERDPGGRQRVAFLEDVFAGQDRIDDRRVRARPADAHLFQRPGQRGFAEAGRRLRGVALGFEVSWRQRVVYVHARQHDVLVGQFGLRIVAAFDIGPQVAGEVDRLAAGLKHGAFRPWAPGFDGDRHAAAAGVGHLAGDRALPDHVVEAELVRRPTGLAARSGKANGRAGRADRLVRFLGVLDFGLVEPRRVGQIFFAVLRGDQVARRFDRHFGQVGRVGSHVRDVAVLVEALRGLSSCGGR